MGKDRTELVFILDKSGSMHGLESDTIGGFNSMLEKQKALEGECRITTVLFDTDYHVIHDRIDIRGVSPLTEKDYIAGGCTALIDAIGKTIDNMKTVRKNTSEEFRSGKVMFVIITDGYENASRRYTSDEVKAQISELRKEYGWEFIFLGANIDAVETAAGYGIDAKYAADYKYDDVGTGLYYQVLSEAAKVFREMGCIPDGCLDPIREDMKKRGEK